MRPGDPSTSASSRSTYWKAWRGRKRDKQTCFCAQKKPLNKKVQVRKIHKLNTVYILQNYGKIISFNSLKRVVSVLRSKLQDPTSHDELKQLNIPTFVCITDANSCQLISPILILSLCTFKTPRVGIQYVEVTRSMVQQYMFSSLSRFGLLYVKGILFFSLSLSPSPSCSSYLPACHGAESGFLGYSSFTHLSGQSEGGAKMSKSSSKEWRSTRPSPPPKPARKRGPTPALSGPLSDDFLFQATRSQPSRSSAALGHGSPKSSEPPCALPGCLRSWPRVSSVHEFGKPIGIAASPRGCRRTSSDGNCCNTQQANTEHDIDLYLMWWTKSIFVISICCHNMT